jgi:hypothetical protein
MKKIYESYGRIGDDTDRFDIEFWQAQGPEATFDAAFQMVQDYMALRHGHDHELTLDRTVEHYGKIPPLT